MDRSKYQLPRTSLLKELGGLNRPSLDLTCAIAHGYMISLTFAEPGVVKGSSWTCEIVANVLHHLTQQGLDVRQFSLVVHGDNCTREVKSNSIVRMLGLLVGRGLLHPDHD